MLNLGLGFVFTCINLGVMLVLGNNVFEKPLNMLRNWRVYTSILLIASISILIKETSILNESVQSILGLVLTFGLAHLMLKLIYNCKNIRAILLQVVFMVFQLVVNILATVPVLIFKDTLGNYANTIGSLLVIIATLGLLQVFLNKLVKFIDILDKNIAKFEKTILIHIFVAIIVVTATAIGYSVYFKQLKESSGFIIGFAILIVLYCVYNLSVANLIVKNKIALIEKQHQEIYVDSYKNIIEDVRRFWHGYSNMISTIQLALQYSNKDINVLLKELFDKYGTLKLKSKLELVQVEHPVLAGLLSLKQGYANSIGVDVYIRTCENIGSLNVNMLDLVDVLGVLIDNAIQAAYYIENKIIEIDLLKNESNFSVKVFNMFEVDESGELKKYGKSNKIGLNVVRNIVSKYKNMEYYVRRGPNWYESNLIINQ